MNQIAGVDGFSLMNNLRLVVIVAIFIILIIVLFYNRVKRSPKRVKQKDMQAVNPSDDSGREERHAADVVDDFFGKEESKEQEKSKVDESTAEPEVEIGGRPSDDSSQDERDVPGAAGDFFGIEEFTEKEKSKGGESAAESEVVIEDQPAVNYEKIEADLKAVRDEVTAKIETDLKAVEGKVTTKIEADLKAVGGEVTTKIEGLISKVEAVEKEILNKIEDVIDAKIQEASNKINDRISEAVRTQMNSMNSISEERVDSLRKEEEPVGIPSTEEPKELAEEKVEFEEKKKSDLEALVKDRDIMEKLRLFVRYQLEAFDILHFDETKTVAEEKKERDLEAPPEVEKEVKVDEKESIDAITSTGEIEEKISERGVGESVGPARLFFQKVLSVGIPSTEESKELLKERDLEAPVEDRDILEKLRLFVMNQLGAIGILSSGESKTVVEEKKERNLEAPPEVKEDVKVEENEPIEAITSTWEVEEKISEGESDDFDIDKLLEEEPVGMSSTEEPKELVEEKVEFEEKKERDLEASVEDRDILEKLAGSLQMDEDSFDVLPSEEPKTVAEEKKERDLEVPSEVKEDVKVDEKEPIESITSTGEVEEKISEGGAGESDDFDIEKLLEEEPVGLSSTEEPKESVEAKVELKEEIEIDLDVPSEVKEDVKVEEKEPIEANTSTGEVEEKITEGDAGESDDFDIEKLLEEEPVGMPSTEELKESVEEKVELKDEIEIDLEVPSEVKEDVKVEEKEPIESVTSTGEVEEKISEGGAGESDDFDIEKLLEEEPVGIPSTEESGEVVEEKVEFKEEKEEGLELPAEETAAHEEIYEKEIDTIAPGDIEEKAIETAKGEEAEEKKQSTIETSDFDIQEFLEELGTPPSEKE